MNNILGGAAILYNGIAACSCFKNSNKLLLYIAIIAIVLIIVWHNGDN